MKKVKALLIITAFLLLTACSTDKPKEEEIEQTAEPKTSSSSYEVNEALEGLENGTVRYENDTLIDFGSEIKFLDPGFIDYGDEQYLILRYEFKNNSLEPINGDDTLPFPNVKIKQNLGNTTTELDGYFISEGLTEEYQKEYENWQNDINPEATVTIAQAFLIKDISKKIQIHIYSDDEEELKVIEYEFNL